MLCGYLFVMESLQTLSKYRRLHFLKFKKKLTTYKIKPSVDIHYPTQLFSSKINLWTVQLSKIINYTAPRTKCLIQGVSELL